MIKKVLFITLLTIIPAIVEGQSYLSVNDLLSIKKCLFNKTQQGGLDILKKRGYDKQVVYGLDREHFYFYQNCRVVEIGGAYSSDGEYLKSDRITDNASYVHFSYATIGVFVHSKNRAQTWLNQLKALGYRQDTRRGGKDNYGEDYYFIKEGKPELRIVYKNYAYKLEVQLDD